MFRWFLVAQSIHNELFFFTILYGNVFFLINNNYVQSTKNMRIYFVNLRIIFEKMLYVPK